MALSETSVPVVLATGDFDDGVKGDLGVGYKNGTFEVLLMNGPDIKPKGKYKSKFEGLTVTDMVSDNIKISDPGIIGEDLVLGFEESIIIIAINQGGRFE